MQSKRRFVWAAMFVAALGLTATGCARSSFKTDLQPLRADYTQRVHFFVFGLAPTLEYNFDEFCPDGKVAQVGIKKTVGNWFAEAFTLSLWNPRWISIRCGQDRRAELAPAGDAGDTATRVAVVQEGGVK